MRIGFWWEFCFGTGEGEGDECEEEREDMYRVERGFEEGMDGEDEEGKSGGELQRFGRRRECALD